MIDNADIIMDFLNVYATVRQVLRSEDIPQLKTATDSAELGLAEFAGKNSNLELSYDGGATYTSSPEKEFTVPADRILYVRKKASGIPNTKDYLKESEPCKVIVNDENIGKKTNGAGIINGISMPKLSLSKKESDGKVYITTNLDIRDYQDYKYVYDWRFDDKPISEWSSKGLYLNDYDTVLVIDPSRLGKDTYQVWCSVSIINLSTSYNFATVDAQIPLIVK